MEAQVQIGVILEKVHTLSNALIAHMEHEDKERTKMDDDLRELHTKMNRLNFIAFFILGLVGGPYAAPYLEVLSVL